MVAVGGTTTYMWAFMLVEYTGRRPYSIQCSMDISLKTSTTHTASWSPTDVTTAGVQTLLKMYETA